MAIAILPNKTLRRATCAGGGGTFPADFLIGTACSILHPSFFVSVNPVHHVILSKKFRALRASA